MQKTKTATAGLELGRSKFRDPKLPPFWLRARPGRIPFDQWRAQVKKAGKLLHPTLAKRLEVVFRKFEGEGLNPEQALFGAREAGMRGRISQGGPKERARFVDAWNRAAKRLTRKERIAVSGLVGMRPMTTVPGTGEMVLVQPLDGSMTHRKTNKPLSKGESWTPKPLRGLTKFYRRFMDLFTKGQADRQVARSWGMSVKELAKARKPFADEAKRLARAGEP